MSEQQKSRVLIVDDMSVNRMILSSLLASNGVTSDLAETGRECLELCTKNSYDLILLDHRMPDYDGVETLVRLKEIFRETGHEIPVVCHTTDDARNNINLYKAAGFADVLIKPIQPQELSKILMTYLPEGQGQDEDREREEKEKMEQELKQLPQWLSDVKGISLTSGIEHCETAEDFLEALTVYASSIPEKADEIERYFKEQNWPKYTLKVHSLKSMSRLIGADELAELAADLEYSAKHWEMDVLTEKTPTLLKDYRGFIPELSKLVQKEQQEAESEDELKEISEEKLQDAYMAISEFLAVYDVDSINMVFDSLKGYRLPQKDSARISTMTQAVSDMDWQALRSILEDK